MPPYLLGDFMILGVGTDLIEIERIRKACENERFFLKIFTEKERKQAAGNIKILAGNFAVKESVAKVFGIGFRGFMPANIEVLRDGLGKPYVILSGGALKRYDSMKMTDIHVTITNSKEYVSAFAVGEG